MRTSLLSGEFGNTFRFWNNPEEVRESGYQGNVWFCQFKRPFGPVTMDVPFENIEGVYQEWKNNEDSRFIQIGESPPLEYRTLNAEVQRTPDGLRIAYNTRPLHRREVMVDVGLKIAYHLTAKSVLKN